MNRNRSLFAATLVAAAGLSLAPVVPARAAEQQLGGDPVPGLCMLSREAVFAQAKVGQAATERLRQLAQQAGAPLNSQHQSLNSDLQNFERKAKSLSETQRKQQGEALQQRMQAYQSQAGELGQRIRLTRAKVMQRISKEAEPILASAYKAHHCGLLLDRDSVLAGNTSNDLTAAVIEGLDHKLTTLSFNLEPLPSGSGSGK